MPDDCLICAKHRGEGPLRGELIARLDGFWVWHAPPGEDGTAPLGHLVIESDQHRPYLADLTDEEAASLGRLRTRLARALRAEVEPSFVFAAVIGTGVAHFHEHLICRHQGTPAEVRWHASDEAGPQVDPETTADLARRVGERLAVEAADHGPWRGIDRPSRPAREESSRDQEAGSPGRRMRGCVRGSGRTALPGAA